MPKWLTNPPSWLLLVAVVLVLSLAYWLGMLFIG
jgi:hypothetical protein